MKIVSKETLTVLREKYPAGTRVELVNMDDPYTSLTAGDKGTVKYVDDMGTIHINWDCGSSLGAVYGEDIVKTIKYIFKITKTVAVTAAVFVCVLRIFLLHYHIRKVFKKRRRGILYR